MKLNNIFKIVASLFAFGIICSTPAGSANTEVVHEDNIVYETPKDTYYDEPAYATEEGEEAGYGVKQVYLHYHNDDGLNIKRRFYVWVLGEKGVEVMPDNVSDDGQDMDLTLNFETDWPQFLNKPSMMFIIKFANTWSGQSEDLTLSYEEFPPNADGRVEAWCIPGEGAGVEIYATEGETQFDKVETAKFVTYKTIECVATAEPKRFELYAFDTVYLRSNSNLQYRDKPTRLFKSGDYPECTKIENDPSTTKDDRYVFYIHFNYFAKVNVKYVLETVYDTDPTRTMSKPVTMENFYLTERFNALYNYDGNDLGMTYTPSQTTFKVWAPTAGNINLKVYNVGTPASLGGDDIARVYNMYFQPGGVWEVTVKGDLAGKYYTYQVDNSLGTSEVCDPYAKSTGVNGIRGYIYDYNSTNPEGWDEIPLTWDGEEGYDIAQPSDLTVYEIHIRDLTMDDTWQGNSPRGTYPAFYESGTTYTDEISGKTVTTGFDHITELGVKAIQIIPFFDNDNDETDMDFNWGYNPVNYNVVEGGYSTNPHDGSVRVKELKELVKAYATNGNNTRVIMDVVYNHVSSAANSNFTKIMPKYYFRYDAEWNYTAGSGCANEVRTEAPMMSKFIVDSVKWWATEYKIKGFRFDLMGLIDTVTMAKLKDALYEIDPDIVVWGEGWDGFGGYNGHKDTHGTYTWNVFNELYPTNESKGHLAAFNDAGRNTLRGGNDQGFGTNNPYPSWGFIAQGSNDVGTKAAALGAAMRGAYNWNNDDRAGDQGANPNQMVSYASCHDNYTLFDQLNYTLADYSKGYSTSNPPAAAEPLVTEVTQAVAAASAAIMYSNTIAFINGGEEIFRTKSQPLEYYDDNSPTSTSEVRPYPDFPAYIDPNNEQEIAKYPEGQVIATGDVWMFGKIISHNSYNSSDETNSFKWDRKIVIEQNGNRYDVSEYNEVFKNMVKGHHELNKFSYPDNTNNQNIETRNTHNGSTVLSVKIGNTVIFFGGREGGNVSFPEANRATLICQSNNNNNWSVTGTTIYVPRLTFLAYRI